MLDAGHQIDVHGLSDPPKADHRGATELTGRIDEWLGLSAFAGARKRVGE